MRIKPIETVYKGYRFRSRLEARWAVFFDTLGVKWDYEKEGFEFNNGEMYLPDFWLPDEGLWVEVKGVFPDDAYMCKLSHFRDAIGQGVLLVVGLPGENMAHLWAYDTNDSGAGTYEEYVDIAAVKRNGRLELITIEDFRLIRDRSVYSDEMFEIDLDVSYLPDRVLFPSVCRAADAAKSARFEFGETPR